MDCSRRTDIQAPSVNTWLSAYEQTSNSTGAIPVIGSYTALCRFALGYIQLISSLVAMTIGLLSSACWERGKDILKNGAVHFCHGAANLGRSLVEMVPILGTCFSFVYDAFWKMRFKYDPAHEITSIPSIWEAHRCIQISPTEMN